MEACRDRSANDILVNYYLRIADNLFHNLDAGRDKYKFLSFYCLVIADSKIKFAFISIKMEARNITINS